MCGKESTLHISVTLLEGRYVSNIALIRLKDYLV